MIFSITLKMLTCYAQTQQNTPFLFFSKSDKHIFFCFWISTYNGRSTQKDKSLAHIKKLADLVCIAFN